MNLNPTLNNMPASTFYQTTAAQAGYIQNPLILTPPVVTLGKGAGKREGDQYDMQEASQGGVELKKSNVVTVNNDGQNALREQVAGTSNYAPDYQAAAAANRANQLKNGNPVFQRGNTLMYDSNGQPINVPTALAQSMAYQDAVNGNRSNSRAEYLTGGGQGAYSSNAQRLELLRQFNSSANLQGTGAVTPYYSDKQQSESLNASLQGMDVNTGQLTDLSQDPNSDLNYANENFDSTGQGTSTMSQSQQIKSQLSKIPQGNSRQAAFQEADQQRAIADMLAKLSKVRDTTASVPITEQIVQ